MNTFGWNFISSRVVNSTSYIFSDFCFTCDYVCGPSRCVSIQCNNVQADALIDEKTGNVGGYVTATAVTTRTATTHEDLGKNEKTQQLEEKTVATTTTHKDNRQEQRVVTQEVKTTATVTSGDQVGRARTARSRPIRNRALSRLYDLIISPFSLNLHERIGLRLIDGPFLCLLMY